MLTITKPSENRVDIVLNGTIDAEEMETALDQLLAASEGVENGKILYTIPEMAWPTLGAMGVEFSRLPKLFGLLGKFKRCAVLSDTGWIKTVAEIEGAIFPGIAIKGFDMDEAEEAEAWLNAA